MIKLLWAIPLWPVMQWLFSIVEALISGHYHSILLSGYWIVFFTCPINWINQFSKNKITSICQPISAPDQIPDRFYVISMEFLSLMHSCSRKDSCIRRLWSFRLSPDLILSFSRIQTYQSSSTFSLSTVMTLVKSSALSMQRYLIHTSEKLVELWKVLWIPKRFVAEGLEILLYNCSSKRSSGKSGVLCFLKNKWKWESSKIETVLNWTSFWTTTYLGYSRIYGWSCSWLFLPVYFHW